jgi:predicted metal-dependent hydrolase
MVDSHRGQKIDPHYAGYFHCFNRQLFYEAHDVLEHIWLPDKHGANGAFYKGLIQLAGAFVHLQKNRLRPAAALFKLARTNLEKYPGRHDGLDMTMVRALIENWLAELESKNFEVNPLNKRHAPKLELSADYPHE